MFVHSTQDMSKGLFTHSDPVTIPVKVYIVSTVPGRMLPVKKPVTVGTMIKLDGDGVGDGDGV